METCALHLRDENNHTILISPLHVIISREGEEWFAQGIELDYAAAGTSLEDVQNRFENGIRETIHAHLEQFNSIDHLLKYAPTEEWKKLKDPASYQFSMVTCHYLDALQQSLPFEKIAYLQLRDAA